jgi:acyl-CoA reductase-like NAD-dependent aldehyde dehydrogenase
MKHDDTRMILATGGGAMVKAAYSSGTPAIGVGAGNGPAYIHRTADVPKAVKRILDSKTFDNGTICASEQSVIVERTMESTVTAELKRQGIAHVTIETEVAGEVCSEPHCRSNGKRSHIGCHCHHGHHGHHHKHHGHNHGSLIRR